MTIAFERLAKWERTLSKCIRCGYCYEHCPIYKSTRWEIDAPRGKLTLLYGLLHGEVEPTGYLANKLFECFHCKRCETACSSGVPLMEVFADARADLIEAGFEVSGTLSLTDHDQCVHCLNCVRMCPHEARSYDQGRVLTDPAKCQSCGSCLDICSACGISITRGFGTNPDEIRAGLENFLSSPRAKAVIFSCSWSSYPGFQTASALFEDQQPETRTFVTACSGRLREQSVFDAFELGAWGVLVFCCPEDDCEHGGAARVKKRMQALGAALEISGIEPGRIRVAELKDGDKKGFKSLSGEFLENLRGLGPIFKGERQ
jgi:coenzyme F420-reducing hydrogenase delta subunit/formate hydrogenlyase subunit 6/NADH:ubiquinone oxidoreductase subunit I